jgi:hypothetical protein
MGYMGITFIVQALITLLHSPLEPLIIPFRLCLLDIGLPFLILIILLPIILPGRCRGTLFILFGTTHRPLCHSIHSPLAYFQLHHGFLQIGGSTLSVLTILIAHPLRLLQRRPHEVQLSHRRFLKRRFCSLAMLVSM